MTFSQRRAIRNAIYLVLMIGTLATISYGAYKIVDKVIFANRISKGF